MNKLINLTSSELQNLVIEALRKEIYGESWRDTDLGWNVWICEIKPFNSQVIYCDPNGPYERTYQIDDESLEVTLADDKVDVELQEAWVPVKMTFTEETDAGDVVDGDYVIKKGWKLFEGGAYPERNQFYSNSHVSSIAANTKKGSDAKAGAKLKMEHLPVPLIDDKWFDDKCGIMNCFAIAKDIFGDVRIPKWLNDLYKSKGWKFAVSVGLTKARDAIEELSLCMYPRVEDAGGFTADLNLAFTKFTTSKTDPPKDPSPTPIPPTFGNPSKTMNLEALKLLFTKSDPKTLTELGLSADQIENLEVKTPKVEIPSAVFAMQNGFVTTKADAFFSELAAPDANGVVHATAGQKQQITTLYRAALKSDGENGDIKFSADTGMPQEGDHVKALRDYAMSFSISTRQNIPAFSRDGNGNTVDPMKVTREGVAAGLGVKIK